MSLLPGSGPVHVGKILRGGFTDALQEDWERSGPALRGTVRGMAFTIVVLLASMGAVYVWVTVSGQSELRAELARTNERAERLAEEARNEARSSLIAFRSEAQTREDVFRAELQTWRSLNDNDIDYIVDVLEAAGIDVPPLNAPTRARFDARIDAALKVHQAALAAQKEPRP